jgi:hypothetical protein
MLCCEYFAGQWEQRPLFRIYCCFVGISIGRFS